LKTEISSAIHWTRIFLREYLCYSFNLQEKLDSAKEETSTLVSNKRYKTPYIASSLWEIHMWSYSNKGTKKEEENMINSRNVLTFCVKRWFYLPEILYFAWIRKNSLKTSSRKIK